MKIIFPPRLKKWDEIRVIAPARSMSILSQDTLQRAIHRLSDMGFVVSFWKHVNEKNMFLSSSVSSRISDLHDAFQDPHVKGIFSVIWGYNSNQLLDFIDYEIIKKNPKVLCGFSDITTLSTAIFAKTGIVGYSWPHFSSWWIQYGFEYSQEYFQKCCMQKDPFFLLSSEQWSDDEWYLNQEKRVFEKNNGYEILTYWKAKGRIIWGHLPCISSLIWTQYFPEVDENILLFLEIDNEFSPEIFERFLQHIIHSKYFTYVKWMVIWRFQRNKSPSLEMLKEIVSSKKELQNMPIVANANFGHTLPFATFPIWGMCELSMENGVVEISIFDHVW